MTKLNYCRKHYFGNKPEGPCPDCGLVCAGREPTKEDCEMATYRNLKGFQPDVPSDDDYVFGAALPMQVLQENGSWRYWLPVTEFQDMNDIEPSACVSFTVLNCVEILIKKQYGISTNWSDRYLAAISDTTRAGNTPRKVIDTLRKKGVVDQDSWGFDGTIDSFEKFYQKPPSALIGIAREFLEDWEVSYEEVPHDQISEALKTSPLLLSVAAWFEYKDGHYYRPDGVQDNHATTLVGETSDHWIVFDSYPPNIKYYKKVKPLACKRFRVTRRENKPNWLADLFKRLFFWL